MGKIVTETATTLPPSQYGRRGTDWSAVCAEIDELPIGKWGKVGQYHGSTVTKIKNGQFPAVDPARYEATARKGEDGNTYIWLRRRKGKR